MLGDKAYDSAELREELDERGTKPVIPNRSNRKQPFTFSKRLYRLRWRIESAFNRLKLPAYRYALRPAGAKLPGLCLPRRRSGMVDLISLDPRLRRLPGGKLTRPPQTRYGMRLRKAQSRANALK
jgi:IS5 family transposase